MNDPLDRAIAKVPPIIGSGCTQRYDPDCLSEQQGTEFPGAKALWARIQGEKGRKGAAAPVEPD